MARTSQTEIERKYAVEGERSLPDLAGVGAASGVRVESVVTLEPYTLEAVYFDTAELALARRRIALRRREGGHDAGWHVKLPAVEGRTELQWPLDHAADADGSAGPAADGVAGSAPHEVPHDVVEAVRVHVRGRSLTPLAQVLTTRRVTELRDGDGRLVAEIADDAVRATDAREGTTRLWHEWEAELGEAAPDTAEGRAALLDAIEARLLEAGATVSPSVSKLAQALGRTGLGAEVPSSGDGASTGAGRVDVTAADPPATAAVRQGLAELVERLIVLDPAVRDDEADALHRFRTTMRRIRSALSIHRALFEATAVDGLRDSLSRFGAVLGEVRDLEVRAAWAAHALDDLAAERGVDDPDAERRLVEDTRAEHAEAHGRLLRAMGQPVYFGLLDSLEELTGAGAWADPTASEAALSPKKEAKRALRKAGRRALARSVPADDLVDAGSADLAEAAGSAGALHDSRKAARRLRHAAEFSSTGAGAVLGSSARTLSEHAEELQDALGLHRDASLFAEFVLLTSRRADAAGESSFTYGVLYQRSLDQARQALEVAEAARRALKRTL
ncbi:CYTH and CHAD domain-containing protein [Herbiconiux liangxiaofengii]|uniref:CYTH and CHAD domain-containing protein n=1 Tax=Herbiconiux liangxiaofengii TaxID=3342795 RepID=UPI0035B87072